MKPVLEGLLFLVGEEGIDIESIANILEISKEEAFNLISRGSINYDQGIIFFNDFVKFTLKLINNAVLELEKIETKKLSKTAHKSDVIQESILNNLPDLFSKEDVARLNPGVSPSTIMRVLKKLHEMNYIIPLGTGRTAKWKKLYNPNKKEYIVGVSKDENND